jgi:hypothetical protein
MATAYIMQYPRIHFHSKLLQNGNRKLMNRILTNLEGDHISLGQISCFYCEWFPLLATLVPNTGYDNHKVTIVVRSDHDEGLVRFRLIFLLGWQKVKKDTRNKIMLNSAYKNVGRHSLGSCSEPAC